MLGLRPVTCLGLSVRALIAQIGCFQVKFASGELRKLRKTSEQTVGNLDLYQETTPSAKIGAQPKHRISYFWFEVCT